MIEIRLRWEALGQNKDSETCKFVIYVKRYRAQAEIRAILRMSINLDVEDLVQPPDGIDHASVAERAEDW